MYYFSGNGMKKTILILLITSIFLSCSRKNSTTVSGEVILEGNGASPVEILIYGKPGYNTVKDLMARTKADRNGKFSISLPGDKDYYFMHVASPGYETVEIRFFKTAENPKIRVNLNKQFVSNSNDAYIRVFDKDKYTLIPLTRSSGGILQAEYKCDRNEIKYDLYYKSDRKSVSIPDTPDYTYGHMCNFLKTAKSASGLYRFNIDEKSLSFAKEEKPKPHFKFIDSPASEQYRKFVEFFKREYMMFALSYYRIVMKNKAKPFENLDEKTKEQYIELQSKYYEKLAELDEVIENPINDDIRDLYLSQKIHFLGLNDSLNLVETFKLISSLDRIFSDGHFAFIPVITSNEFKRDPLKYLPEIEKLTEKAGTPEKITMVRFDIYRNMLYDKYDNEKRILKLLEKRVHALNEFASEDYIKTSIPEVLTKIKLKRGSSAPDFKFTDLRGNQTKLSDFRLKWVLLDFWNLNCSFCIRDIPNLKKAYNNYKDQGFEIISIYTGDPGRTPEEVSSYCAKKEMHWTMTIDYEGYSPGIGRLYGITGYPTLYLVNPEGKFVKIDTRELRGDNLDKTIGKIISSNRVIS